jgi:hypothetical protein
MSKKNEVVVDELLSTEQAAEVAQVTARTIRRWFAGGLVVGESVPFGSRVLIRVSRLSLETYLSEKPDRVG